MYETTFAFQHTSYLYDSHDDTDTMTHKYTPNVEVLHFSIERTVTISNIPLMWKNFLISYDVTTYQIKVKSISYIYN